MGDQRHTDQSAENGSKRESAPRDKCRAFSSRRIFRDQRHHVGNGAAQANAAEKSKKGEGLDRGRVGGADVQRAEQDDTEHQRTLTAEPVGQISKGERPTMLPSSTAANTGPKMPGDSFHSAAILGAT